MNWKYPLIAGLTLCLSYRSLAQLNPQATIATVNGVAIHGDEYYRRMEFLPDVGTLIGDRYFQETPGFLTIQKLISETLLIQLAEERGVAPKAAEIDQDYRDRLTVNPNLEKDWLAGGRSIDELKYQIRIDLIQFRIVTAGINVTDSEVKSDYDNNPDKYTTPRLAELRVIVVNDDSEKAAVDADLAAGKAFAEVAKARSADISKLRGGEYGNVPLASLPAPIKVAIQATKIGETTQWIPVPQQPEGGTASMKFLFVNATESKLQPFSATMQENIRRSLMLQRGSVKNNLVQLMTDMRKKAKVTITNPQFADAYKRYQSGGTLVGK